MREWSYSPSESVTRSRDYHAAQRLYPTTQDQTFWNRLRANLSKQVAFETGFRPAQRHTLAKMAEGLWIEHGLRLFTQATAYGLCEQESRCSRTLRRVSSTSKSVPRSAPSHRTGRANLFASKPETVRAVPKFFALVTVARHLRFGRGAARVLGS